MAFADARGVRIYHESRGSGPPLLLIPGIPAISSDWFPFADPLTEHFRVIAYDNRGSGRSEAPAGPYTTAQMAADAAAVLDDLGLDRSHVFGISMGGMIAQELALGFPDRVLRLVLGCTHGTTATAVPPTREVGLTFAQDTEDWAQRMRLLAPHAFAPGADPELIRAFVAKKVGDVQPEHGYRAQIAAVLAHDALDRLRDLRIDTLVITGDADAIIPATNGEALHDAIPGARLEVIPNAGHLFFLEAPQRTRNLLTDFLLAAS